MKIHRALYYLLLFFLPTQLGFHMWPAWSHVLGRRIDYLSPTIYFTDTLLVVMVLFWIIESRDALLNYVLRIKEKKEKILHTKSFRHPMSVALFLLILIAGNILNAQNTMTALYGWIKAIEFSLFFYYIKKTKPSFIRSSFVFILTMTYSSSIAITQFVFQRSIGGFFWFLGERTFDLGTPGIARFDWCGLFVSSCRPTLRPYATFPHPNVLAGYIVAFLPVFVFLMQKKIRETPPVWEKIGRFVIPAIIFLSIVTLILTFSRSALIVGFIVFFLCFVLNVVNNKKTKAMLFMLLACIAITLGMVGKQLSFSSESVLMRQDLNTNAVALWKASPLFGVGLKNSIASLPNVMYIKQVYFLQPIHNVYLLVLAETGIVGVAFFLWIIIRIIDRLCQQLKQKGHTVALIKTLSFASLLLLGLVDHYSLTLQQGQLLFTYIIGMSYIES